MARFATRTREQQVADRQRKQAKREQRQRAEEHERRIATKDAAAAAVKRLRAAPRSTADETAAADAAYRVALADLIAFETGTLPAWAPSEPDDPAGENDETDAAPINGSPETA